MPQRGGQRFIPFNYVKVDGPTAKLSGAERAVYAVKGEKAAPLSVRSNALLCGIFVGQRIGVYIDEVGLRIYGKLHGLNRFASLNVSLRHPMHSVHHTSIGRKNDWVTQIRLLDQPRMFGHHSACRFVVFSAKPVCFIQLTNR